MLETAARESELVAARAEHEERLRGVRDREQELARNEARLASLDELEATRGEFGDAARMVLVQANGHVGQQGAVADYLDVDSRYERAVEACLGDLLQHVIVERHDQAAAGLALVREQDAGRCGFVVIDPGSNGYHPRDAIRMPGIVPLADVLRIAGPHVATIQKVVPEAYVADSFDQAVVMSRQTSAPVATLEGDVLRGPHVVCGGAKAESRGILATKREIKELRERTAAGRDELARLTEEASRLEIAIAQATSALAALTAEQHRQDMAIVAHAGAGRRAPPRMRCGCRARRKSSRSSGARPRKSGRCSRRATPRPKPRSARLVEDQRVAEGRLSEAQRRAHGRARDGGRAQHEGCGRPGRARRPWWSARRRSRRKWCGSRKRPATSSSALRRAPRSSNRHARRREALLQAIADETGRSTTTSGRSMGCAPMSASPTKRPPPCAVPVDGQDAVIRDARRGLDEIRAHAGELELARATAQSDLGHLAQMCARDGAVLARPGAGGSRADGAGGRDDARRRRDHRRRTGSRVGRAGCVRACPACSRTDEDRVVGANRLPR